jgi:class 3 adenylate cyclase
MEGIAERARLVTYDPRGFGLSDREVADHSAESSALDLEAVADAAALENFIIQAFAATSIPALIYAAHHPERVTALVLPNGITRGADMSASWKRLVRLAEEDWGDAKVVLARMNTAGYASTATLQQSREMLDEASSQEAFLAHSRALEGWDASGVVSSVTAPTLVSHYGELATHTPLEACRRLATSLPNGRFVSLVADDSEGIVGVATRSVRSFLRDIMPAESRVPRQRQAVPPGTAVIVFADIVDSTALTERLGDAAFRERARELDGALRKIIREAGGTPVEGRLLGDGVLAVFRSARQAIEAALKCGAAGEDGGLPLHLGVHAGDVIEEEGNVFGGAVNIAARIAGESAPGEVLVSATVRDLARTSAGVGFEDAGERRLKGIEDALRVWRLTPAGEGGRR